jgi:flagellar hook-associated protein 3 FlgL
MRITQGMMNNQALSNIQNIFNRQTKLYNQLTTGKKIQHPSDNAAIASRMSNLDSRIREIDRYQSNINLATSYVQMYDSSLQEMDAIYLRIKELSVRGATDSLAEDDRRAIVEELETLKSHLASIANTQVSDRYIFGGSKSDVPPVNEDNFLIQTPPTANNNLKISVGGYDVDYGLTVFEVFNTGTGSSVFQIIDRLQNSLESGEQNKIQNELGAIDNIQKNSLMGLSKVGGTERLLNLAKSRLEDFSIFSKDFLSKESDVDMAEVYMDLAMQQSVLQSALKVTSQIIPPTLVDFIR